MDDAPFPGAVEPGNAVQDAGLSRAVGPDEGEQLTLAHLHVQTGERGHTPEAEGEVVEFEERRWFVHGGPWAVGGQLKDRNRIVAPSRPRNDEVRPEATFGATTRGLWRMSCSGGCYCAQLQLAW